MSTLEKSGPERITPDVLAMVTASPDPMRPQDLTIPGAVTTAPPCCPLCLKFLHPINQNQAGDILFECLSDHATGYTTVFRVETGEYEQRPGATSRWAPPLSYAQVLARQRVETP
jgi:hypothetical protein